MKRTTHKTAPINRLRPSRIHVSRFPLSMDGTILLLLLLPLVGCRDKTHQAPPKRPGNVDFVHPLAQNVRRTTLQGRRIVTMDVPVPLRRMLAYYEHGLAGSWHLVERESTPQGMVLRVRRGRQLLDIYLRSTKTGTHVRLIAGLQAPTDEAAKAARSHPGSDAGIERDNGGGRHRRTLTRHSKKRTKDSRTLQPLPRKVRLPKGWTKSKASSYLNESRNLTRLARQLQAAFKAQGWTVMPTPDTETSDRPNRRDLVVSKNRQVIYFHLRSTAEGTILTWLTASL